MPGTTRPLHVSLVAIPDAVISTLTGIYDVLGSFRMLGRLEPSIPDEPPFTVEIVATERGNVALASGVPVEARRAVSEIAATDIIIVPSVLLGRRRLDARPLPGDRRLGPAHACARAHCSARPARACSCSPRPGSSTAGRRRFTGAMPTQFAKVFPTCAAEPRARAGGLGRARGVHHLRRLDDLARPRALSDRPACRRDRGADGGALLRAAMAP